MSDNERSSADDQKVMADTQSQRKTETLTAESTDSPAMGAETCPPQSDAQQPETENAPAPVADERVPASTPATTAQVVAGRPKSEIEGNPNHVHKNTSGRHYRPGYRRNQGPRPPMVPPPHVAGPVFANGPYGPYPIHGAPCMDPHTGYMAPPGFPEPVYYWPVTRPGAMRGPYRPYFPPYPVNQGPPALSLEQIDLKYRIIKQIEYYFSDGNLQPDHYIISQMDEQGWVPIKTIARFKRVKAMTRDIPFILFALQSSACIQVQGDKIRKRDEWEKWLPCKSSSVEEDADSGRWPGTQVHSFTRLITTITDWSGDIQQILDDLSPYFPDADIDDGNLILF